MLSIVPRSRNTAAGRETGRRHAGGARGALRAAAERAAKAAVHASVREIKDFRAARGLRHVRVAVHPAGQSLRGFRPLLYVGSPHESPRLETAGAGNGSSTCCSPHCPCLPVFSRLEAKGRARLGQFADAHSPCPPITTATRQDTTLASRDRRRWWRNSDRAILCVLVRKMRAHPLPNYKSRARAARSSNRSPGATKW